MKEGLEAERQRKREQRDQANAAAKTALQLQVEINDLKLANRDIERQINKLGIKVRKPLEELQQEKAALERDLLKTSVCWKTKTLVPLSAKLHRKKLNRMSAPWKESMKMWSVKNRSFTSGNGSRTSSRSTAGPFKLVALAVGIVLSALALAATNGLKAGTKAIGNGLKAIGQKLGSSCPGSSADRELYLQSRRPGLLLPGGARLAAHPCRGGLLHGKVAQEATKINTHIIPNGYRRLVIRPLKTRLRGKTTE